MDRDYKTGRSDSVGVFSGFEVEHTPALGKKTLFLARNDPLLNNFEEHLLLMNLGNVDWRPLIKLWSVLEYQT